LVGGPYVLIGPKCPTGNIVGVSAGKYVGCVVERIESAEISMGNHVFTICK
jgi:hypothetical protein